jgi:hypothetical protein
VLPQGCASVWGVFGHTHLLLIFLCCFLHHGRITRPAAQYRLMHLQGPRPGWRQAAHCLLLCLVVCASMPCQITRCCCRLLAAWDGHKVVGSPSSVSPALAPPAFGDFMFVFRCLLFTGASLSMALVPLQPGRCPGFMGSLGVVVVYTSCGGTTN